MTRNRFPKVALVIALFILAGSSIGLAQKKPGLTNDPVVTPSATPPVQGGDISRPRVSFSFIDHLTANLKSASARFRVANQNIRISDNINDLCPVWSEDDLVQEVSSRVLRDYGAIFIGDNSAMAGYRFRTNGKFLAQCVFNNEAEVAAYQGSLEVSEATVGGTRIRLSKDAMTALLNARTEASSNGLSITPRGGSVAAGRNYADTERLWKSRFVPGLAYWTKRGRISAAEAKLASAMPTTQQVAKVLKWEAEGIYFSTDFSKSILYSVAAPGASQHVFLLALDVAEFGNKDVRAVLAKHGWFQTVYSDLPHFTYLGPLSREELARRGLVSKMQGGQEFWIPNID